MFEVKNNATGEVQNLESDADLPSIVQQSDVSIPNKDYEFESPEGEKYKVPAQGFLDAVKMGWKYRDQNIVKEEGLKAEYGDSTAKALLYGGLRGATLGLSDAILPNLPLGITQEELANVKKYNPVSSGLAEVGTTLAPVLLSGGAGLAGRAIVAKQIAKGATLEAAEAAALKAGQTTVNKIASLSPTALVSSAAEMAGLQASKRAAQNITSKVAQKAIEMGTAGAIEGAVLGVGQTVSEASLGDSEFNAESLMSNVGTGALVGAGIGSLIGAGTSYADKAIKGGAKQFKKALVRSSDMSEAEKLSVIKKIDADEELASTARQVFEDADFKEMASKNGWPTTPGMESRLKLYQTLESSIAEGASAPAVAVQKNIDEVYNTIEKEIRNVAGKGDSVTPLVAGDEIKRVITLDVDSRLAPQRDFLSRLDKEMGNAPISDIIQKRAINRLSKSPSYRLAENPRAKYVVDLIKESKNLNDLDFTRKEIGKILGGIRKSGQDIELESFMTDAYATIKRAKKDAVIKNSLELGPKKGLAMAKKITKAMDEADNAYKQVYKDYAPVAERFGIKLNGPDFFIDSLNDAASEKIGSKLIDLNDYRFMEELYKKQPEIYDLARKTELGKILKKATDSTTGDISPVRFAREIRNKTPEQKKILFGFDKESDKRLNDLLKYIEKAPKKLGKSDTATVQFFQKILSPAYQATEYARYLLYKGGDAAIKKHFSKDLPVYGVIEQSANKQKNSIASAVNGFFKSSGLGVTAASLETFDSNDVKKAKKAYDLVQTNPEAVINKYVNANKELIDAAPETSNALQQRITAGVQFLQSKTPQRDDSYIGESLTPSRSELMRFNDYVEAVEDPKIVFNQLKQGYLNPNSIEALRVVYPKTFASIQSELMAKLPKSLTRQQKIQLQPILGSKVTPSMDYNNLMRLQGKTDQSSQAQKQASMEINKVPVGAAKNMKVAQRSMTGLDRTLNRA